MRETGSAQVRPYHHGDLSRALIEAARRILEAEGPAALSLRAVAREAGVSPAAPYHHFKDKTELLEAVAREGWEAVGQAITAARHSSPDPGEALGAIGMAYLHFARENPALYRLMYDTSRDRTSMPEHENEEDSGLANVQGALIEAGADPTDELELQLATVASWCAVHGLAEMCNFKEFAALKEKMGGDEAFLRGILRHFGTFQARGPKH
ncbi:MAG TPA: TetR/AcrR family transcriptional regulator [Caulobacteraceae bacterium]|jgi:AcrR family transcriptional regulator|nr:TetR/AcrR family transcriptional regulator [Caulobacteraceae bacterium]